MAAKGEIDYSWKLDFFEQQQTYRMRNIKDSCPYYDDINMNEIEALNEVN